jgi:hypothetical protein
MKDLAGTSNKIIQMHFFTFLDQVQDRLGALARTTFINFDIGSSIDRCMNSHATTAGL